MPLKISSTASEIIYSNMSDQSVGVYKALCQEIEVKNYLPAITQDVPGELDDWTTDDEEVWHSRSTISMPEVNFVSIAPTIVGTRPQQVLRLPAALREPLRGVLYLQYLLRT